MLSRGLDYDKINQIVIVAADMEHDLEFPEKSFSQEVRRQIVQGGSSDETVKNAAARSGDIFTLFYGLRCRYG